MFVSVTVRYGMKSVIASCLAVTVAAVAFIGSELRDETLWWEEKFVVSDGATANRAFFENGGYRGQSCGDRDVLTQWFHDLHFGEVGDDLGQFGWAFHELGLREEEYVHTWDREAYLRAIATEPRWMEVLDRLCADQI